MKNLLQTLVIAILIAFTNTNLKAQYVTIPDPYFAELLNERYPACMNGNMLDTTCAEILTEEYLNIYAFQNPNIMDITGITYFKNLYFLQIFDKQLTELPSLPETLVQLVINDCQLTNLPNLPSSLYTLSCLNNQIISLPSLPSSLVSLACSNNILTSLPNLPQSLYSLDCSNNQLLSLPNLPQTLDQLNCSNNSNISLPSFPQSLTTLKCSNNELMGLPSLPTFLRILDCSNNPLSSLPAIQNLLSLNIDNTNISCFPEAPILGGINWNNTGIECIPAGLVISSSVPDINTFPSCIDFNPNECSFTQTGDCSKVQNLTTDLETNGYMLSWDPPAGSTKCEVRGGIVNKRQFTKIITGTEPSSKFISESKLRGSSDYQWKVRCNCETSNEFGPFSDLNFFTTGTDLDFGFPKSNNQEQNIFVEESNLVTNSKNNPSLFPNPAKGNFVIQSDLKNYNLQVTDITGKLVYSQNNVTETSLLIDIENIEAGTYFVNITNENAKDVIKLLVY
jgi:Secretion system C-terminal sorting domain